MERLRGPVHLSILALLAALFLPVEPQAATRTVCPSGCDHAAIQPAIDASGDGDTVLVHDGTYRERLDFRGKPVAVRSVNGPQSTVIDGGGTEHPGAGSVVSFRSGEGPESVLEGFTVTNGSAPRGGGILIDYTSPTIADCIIEGNRTVYDSINDDGGWGGGIHVRGGSPEIRKCVIRRNVTDLNGKGGGVAIFGYPSATPRITGCRIQGNASRLDAGGIYAVNAKGLTVTNSFITGNGGGGIGLVGGSTRLLHCTVSGNGVYPQTAGYPKQCALTVENSIISGIDLNDCYNCTPPTVTVRFSNVPQSSPMQGEPWPGEGNIAGDPLFVEPLAGSLPDGSAGGDFHLRPASPCVNRAVPGLVSEDIDGEPRPWGSASDMGADEAYGMASANLPPTIAALPPLMIEVNSGLQTVNLSGISAGGWEVQPLTVAASSSNPGLIPNPTVNYTSPDATGSLSFTPLPNASGRATLTVTVNDGQAANSTEVRTFLVRVKAVNTEAPPAFHLPDSDQRTCHQVVSPWAEIPCAGTGQDGAYVRNPLSYTDNGNGTVTDNNTGLVWQQRDDGKSYNWYQASGTYDAILNPEWTDVCASLDLGGAADWRLPTKKELMSIVDYGIPSPGPTIDTTYFQDSGMGYWSSTTIADKPSRAWLFFLFYGAVDSTDINTNSAWGGGAGVRCVRGGQTPGPILTDNGDGTVTDSRTGLVWQQGEPGRRSQGAAQSYCERLDLAGKTDWRLPNVKELESLTDDTRSMPAIDTASFPAARAAKYWSSTTDPNNPRVGADYDSSCYPNGRAWSVDFADGAVGNNSSVMDCKAYAFSVRCVRGGSMSAAGYFFDAVDDAATTVVNTAAVIPVLLNDLEYDAGPLALAAVGMPGHGSTTRSGDTVIYSPQANWSGTDTFTYTVSDARGRTDTARVTVAVTALPTYLVTPSAGAGGTISPDTAQRVGLGGTASFTVTAKAGYRAGSVTGCGGTLSGARYTTGAISDACAVTATFVLEPTGYQLPDTDVRKCFDFSDRMYKEIPCAGSGQDGEYNQNPLRYNDNGNGTVTDNNTGLVWQQEDDGKLYNWYQASGTYDATYNPGRTDVCGSLDLGGITGWRLPDKMELIGILDYAKLQYDYPGPAISTEYFPIRSESSYWSSTTFPSYGYYGYRAAFQVSFFPAGINIFLSYVNEPQYQPELSVRCVRGERSPGPVLADNGDGTVTDFRTGRVWQQGGAREGEPGRMTWTEALSLCEGLDLGGKTDWRLPNIKELQSLVDDTRVNPMIDTGMFPNAQPCGYWSSTVADPYFAHSGLKLDFGSYYPAYSDFCKDGFSGSADVDPFFVRCVRGGPSPPVVNGPPTDIFLSRNIVRPGAPAGATVGTLSTSDPDFREGMLVPRDTFTYALVAGAGSADNASFTIAGNALATAAVFDSVTRNSYSIRVRTTDQGGLSFEKVFSIGVTDTFVLPDSDQRKCYREAGPYSPQPEIPCAGTGQDGAEVHNALSYTDNGDGTATDNNTGLIWQRQDDGKQYDWYQATDVCGSLDLGGATDWRLPTRGELTSIVDYAIPGSFGGINQNPAIHALYFPSTKAGYYWSSTSTADVSSGAWLVYFGGGYVLHEAKSSRKYVRCVRGGRAPEPGLADNGNGTVTDAGTGLVWQQGEPGGKTWGAALSYCQGLDLAGWADWRLPNVKELDSLVDDTRLNPAIDTARFPHAQASSYWSSTTMAAMVGTPWDVDFSRGKVGFGYSGKDSAKHVRCVRGAAFSTRPFATDQTVIVLAGTPKAITLLAPDADGDPLAYTVLTEPVHGALSGTPPELTYTPAADYSGGDSFTFKANDGTSDSNTATVSVMVVHAPVAGGDAYLVLEGGTLHPAAPGVLGNDTDADSPSLTAVKVSDPAHGSLTLNADGSFTYVHDGSETASDAFTYRVNDGAVDSNVATVSIAVTPVNDAPTLLAVNARDGHEGALLEFTPTASDPDGGDTLRWSVSAGLPSGAGIDGATGLFTWTPGYDQEGSWPMTFTVTDRGGSADSKSATVTVGRGNRPPKIEAIPDQTVVEGAPIAFQVSATDPDGDAIVLSMLSGPPAAGFSALTGDFSWLPGYADAGSYEAVFRARDNWTTPATDEVTVPITVTSLAAAIFMETFADGSAAGDPDWTVLAGTWPVSTQTYVSGAKANGVTRVKMLDPATMPIKAGVIQAKIKLTSTFSKKANGSILFSLQDATRYRYVRHLAGKIVIGQAGSYGGVTAGAKKTIKTGIKVGAPRTTTVKVFDSGLVEVWSGTKMLGSYPFPSAVPGGVGLAAAKAKTIFDDVIVWDDSVLTP